MAKTFFHLPGYYEGLRARRIRHSGRLWLVKIISDPDREKGAQGWKPYWFVLIKGFDLKRDKASGAKTIGVWRFQWADMANAKFDELLPLYPAPAAKKLSEKQLEARNLFAERMKSSKKPAQTPK